MTSPSNSASPFARKRSGTPGRCALATPETSRTSPMRSASAAAAGRQARASTSHSRKAAGRVNATVRRLAISEPVEDRRMRTVVIVVGRTRAVEDIGPVDHDRELAPPYPARAQPHTRRALLLDQPRAGGLVDPRLPGIDERDAADAFVERRRLDFQRHNVALVAGAFALLEPTHPRRAPDRELLAGDERIAAHLAAELGGAHP